ncbi:D-glycerate dehydrogenase [Bdellovibrio bacteriovorus]|uniref:D-glycerate dehydrogenase n=1 Tax=Bdellovibrio bacteriovorus TaxID=959 RepID=A0A150WJA5_BDEBC|nr:D-glycerate dehydrogenase [Bdellovibrio bacteriovorus]KYG63764.1 D-glycerate dehydrogenase [Bdellovibrio bacteriovorus]
MQKLFISYPAPPNVIKKAQGLFITTAAEKAVKAEEILAYALQYDPDAILVSHQKRISAEIISKLPKSVKIIATSSVGFDHIDIQAAKAKGIEVTNTPDVLTDCTADLAMMLLMNACRRGREYLEIMQEGWGKSYSQSEMLGLKVSGKTLGILGMGRIGQALADRARGFGMKILYTNRTRLSPELEKGAVYFSDFKEMLPLCEILSLNAPVTDETKNIMNDETFGLLPQDAVFVNAARGGLVDESALIRALESGRLFAAGLDVFQDEPNYNQDLLKFHNVFLTPHMGSATRETRDAMGFRALANIEAVLRGEKPQDSLW